MAAVVLRRQVLLSVSLKNPDFVAISKGFKLESAKVEQRAELSAALDVMFAHEGGYVLEVVVRKKKTYFRWCQAAKPAAMLYLGRNLLNKRNFFFGKRSSVAQDIMEPEWLAPCRPLFLPT